MMTDPLPNSVKPAAAWRDRLDPRPVLAAMPAAWRAFLPPMLLAVAVLLLTLRDTVAAMVGIWSRSETFAHAFVVPPIALWLIWRQREALARLTPKPMWWMLVPIAGLVLAWTMGQIVVANAVTQLALMALLVALVPAILGWAVALEMVFPLTFMFFAVPIGESLTPILMQGTADFTVAALQASGIPVYREGLQFVIPSGNWSVVEACSGLRYLMASFMVGTLFAYLNYTSAKRRWIFVAVSIAVPVVANWLRAYMIVMLGHLSGNRLATGVDHLVYGWVFFGIVIMSLFWIGARWAEPPLVLAPRHGDAPGANTWHVGPAWALTAVLAALLALPPMWLANRAGQAYVAPTLKLPDALPDALSGQWHATDTALTDWAPIYAEPSAVATRVYASADGAQVGLHIAYYRQQNEQRKLVSTGNMLVRGEDHVWNRIRSDTRSAATPNGTIDLNTAEILGDAASDGTRERLLVWQWYWIGGRLAQTDVAAKLTSATQLLTGKADESASLVLYVRADGSDAPKANAAGQAVLARFLRDNWAALDAQLRETGHLR